MKKKLRILLLITASLPVVSGSALFTFAKESEEEIVHHENAYKQDEESWFNEAKRRRHKEEMEIFKDKRKKEKEAELQRKKEEEEEKAKKELEEKLKLEAELLKKKKKEEEKKEEKEVVVEEIAEKTVEEEEEEEKEVTTSTSEVSAAEDISSEYTLSDLKFQGVIHWGGYKFTFYSQSVLPGGGLDIPGRHVNSGGFVADGDGFIVVANDAPKGTIIQTPFGAPGKVYDRGTVGNHIDIYTK